MMVITSKLYLKSIHEAAKKEEADSVDIAMQERVLASLNDWEPDDYMIDGYDYSTFSPYLHLVDRDEIAKQIVPCEICGYTYLKTKVKYHQ